MPIGKLQLAGEVRLITEKDGLLVDDDEILSHVSDEALTTLQEDQNWKQHATSVEQPLPATVQCTFMFCTNDFGSKICMSRSNRMKHVL